MSFIGINLCCHIIFRLTLQPVCYVQQFGLFLEPVVWEQKEPLSHVIWSHIALQSWRTIEFEWYFFKKTKYRLILSTSKAQGIHYKEELYQIKLKYK